MRPLLTCSLLLLLCTPIFGSRPVLGTEKLSQRLRDAYQVMNEEDEYLVWVYFTDKGIDSAARLESVKDSLSPHARKRRLTVRSPESIVDQADAPVEEYYLNAITGHVGRIRHTSRWLNAVSVLASRQQIEMIRSLPFVREVDLVARITRIVPQPVSFDQTTVVVENELASPQATLPFNYGPSLAQLEQINVPAVHEQGLFGQGVIIGVFDSGFNNLGHEAFQQMKIIAAHDFVNGDDDVGDGDDMGAYGLHGTGVLSVIGGFAEGELIGPAFEASYILAKTENHPTSETPSEEDNWVAALEWAEGLGVDVISSSVGYVSFDPPFPSYTWQDMDGQTTAITRAAVLGVQRGIVIVNAAGNSGNNPFHNTLMGPADGDGVIAAGAVTLEGNRAGFSSVGPTVDGRIKPDVMAAGVGVRLAGQNDIRQYGQGSGTSFATPLVAGVAALILTAHPDWPPAQVLDALRSTSNNHESPNKLVGWGIVDALAAIAFDGTKTGPSSQ